MGASLATALRGAPELVEGAPYAPSLEAGLRPAPRPCDATTQRVSRVRMAQADAGPAAGARAGQRARARATCLARGRRAVRQRSIHLSQRTHAPAGCLMGCLSLSVPPPPVAARVGVWQPLSWSCPAGWPLRGSRDEGSGRARVHEVHACHPSARCPTHGRWAGAWAGHR